MRSTPIFYTGSIQAVFYFYIFQFCFLQKYIFVFEIYRNIPRPPRCRTAGTWPPRCRAAGVFSAKLFVENLRPGPWRTGRPAAGRPAPQVARQRGGRLPLRYIRVWLPPHLSFESLKIQKKERDEEGREAKPCRIFEPATAGNQNSFTLYK